MSEAGTATTSNNTAWLRCGVCRTMAVVTGEQVLGARCSVSRIGAAGGLMGAPLNDECFQYIRRCLRWRGHNALIAACYLANDGRSVCLLDQRPAPGGWVHSEELTQPGFVHDADSELHPIFVNGPVFAELGAELAEYGLRYAQSSVSTGASFPDGRAAAIQTEPVAFSDELARLGERQAWSHLMADVSPQLNSLLSLLGMDLASPINQRRK